MSDSGNGIPFINNIRVQRLHCWKNTTSLSAREEWFPQVEEKNIREFLS